MLRPQITEKSLKGVEKENAYTFKVGKFVTKHQAKKIIEETFGVKVLTIRTKPIRGKTKRKQGLNVRSSDTKEIIALLDKKDKIGLFEVKEGGK